MSKAKYVFNEHLDWMCHVLFLLCYIPQLQITSKNDVAGVLNEEQSWSNPWFWHNKLAFQNIQDLHFITNHICTLTALYTKNFILRDHTTRWLTVIAQSMWMERAMHKTEWKHKLFVEKHDREKVNFQTVVHFYKVLNDVHARARTLIFSQFINWKMGFA
jgi:hypothetical protein